jgi:hypothetical protein
MTKAP